MKFKISVPEYLYKYQYLNLFIVSFLTFAGFYFLLSIFVALGMESFTRYLTIPVRLLINILAVIHIIFFGFANRLKQPPALAFYIFSIIYLIRIIWELLNGNTNYHIPTYEFLLYYISFSVVPFTFFYQAKHENEYKIIYKGVFFGSLLFSMTSIFLYGFLIGEDFGRISRVFGVVAISPLSISYSASILLGLSFWKFIDINNNVIRQKIFYLVAFVLGVIPFFLGSSRGSVFALVFSLLFIIVVHKGYKISLKFIFWGVLIGVILFWISDDIGTSLFERLFGIGDAIALGDKSANRLIMWKKSLNQFFKSPFVGNSLESSFVNFYPHNFLIESLITTGFLGFGLLLTLILMAFNRSIKIVKHKPELIWIVIIYIQALVQSSFTGGMYQAVWLYSSLGLIFSVRFDS